MFKPVWVAFSLLEKRDKTKFLTLVFSRVFVQLLDLLGLAAVGFIGALLASGLKEGETSSFLGLSIAFQSSDSVLILVLVTVALFMVKSVIASLLLRATTKFLARVEAKSALEITRYMFSGGLHRLKNFSSGEHVWVAVPASTLAFSVMLFSGAAVITESALLITVFSAFLIVDVSTSLIIASYFAAIAILFQFTINRRLKRLGQRLQENSISSNDSVLDITGAFREISVLQRLAFFLEKFNLSRSQLAADIALQKFVMGFPRFFVEAALMLGFLSLVVWQFLRGSLEDGLVITGVFLTGGLRMMAALLPLQNAISEIRTKSVEARKAMELLAEARKAGDGVREKLLQREARGDIDAIAVELKGVSFNYPDSEREIIRNLDISIERGTFAALVGPSGAGKTTVADLILGLLVPTLGEVLLDGIPAEVFTESQPGGVAYVPQRPGMVKGTIAENIALGVCKEQIDRDRVREVLEKTGLSQFVTNLPMEIDSDLGKRVDALSGGQIQRLGIARALYFSPRLLVLDEATSALDAETEDFVTQEIRNLGDSMTVVVIAHRLSTIQKADQVHVLDDGALVASGTFSEVRKTVPLIERYVELMAIKDSNA